jgi:uncharacterized membrane protein
MTTELQTPQPKRDWVAHIRNRIFAGILFAGPVVVTILIFNFILDLATAWFPAEYLDRISNAFGGYLLKLVLLLCVLVFFYCIGVFTYYVGKRATGLVDDFFSKIPFLKTIYSFMKKFREWVENRRSSIFDSVVLVPYPYPKSFALGLVTAQTSPSITKYIKDSSGTPVECVNVFVPTTPNPTSGFFLIYPKTEVRYIDMDVNTAINLIMSAGALLPDAQPMKEEALPRSIP